MLRLGLFTWLEERKGEERATLNYTCSNSSAPIQLGPTRCLPSRFTAFVSVASLYMHSVSLLLCMFLCAALLNNFRIVEVVVLWGEYVFDKSVLLFAFQSAALHRTDYTMIAVPVIQLQFFMCLICINPTFPLGPGVRGSYFSGKCDRGTPPPHLLRCVCAACVYVHVCLYVWQRDLHALMMRDQGEDGACQHP